MKREILSELERLSEAQQIDLYYGDEAAVSLEPCVPYAWQFPDEQVAMPSSPGKGVNRFALLRRDNRARAETTEKNIPGDKPCRTAGFISEQFERLSLMLRRLTVVVVDNAGAAGASYQRANRGVARARVVHLLLTALFAAPEYSREAMAQVEIRMAYAQRL